MRKFDLLLETAQKPVPSMADHQRYGLMIKEEFYTVPDKLPGNPFNFGPKNIFVPGTEVVLVQVHTPKSLQNQVSKNGTPREYWEAPDPTYQVSLAYYNNKQPGSKSDVWTINIRNHPDGVNCFVHNPYNTIEHKGAPTSQSTFWGLGVRVVDTQEVNIHKAYTQHELGGLMDF
jgi:hypothetical protein